MIVWTLKIAGTTKSLASWSITAAQLVFRSLAADELTLALLGDTKTACPLAYGQAVTLYRDGVAYFIGTVAKVSVHRTPERAGWLITAKNAWWQLERTIWQQDCASYNGACGLQTIKTSKAVLFQDPLVKTQITTAQQITNLIQHAALQGIAIAPGATPLPITLPFEVVRDLTLAAALIRCLQLTPDAVSWFDYSAGVPVLNFAQRATATAAEIDLEANPPIAQEWELASLDELVPAGVRLNYIGLGVCPAKVKPGCVDPTTGLTNTSGVEADAADSTQGLKITQDTDGLPDGPGGIVGTIDLAQLGATETEPAPVGLAAQYRASLLTPFWQGTLRLAEQDCSGTVRPGKVLNLANGAAAWATMRALVQEVSEDLFMGRTVITFGPPAWLLGPDAFAQLVRWTHRRPLVQDAFAAVRPPGTEQDPNCDAGLDARLADLLAKLKGNRAAAVQSLGAEAISDALTSEAGGTMTTSEVEVCDPPGNTLTVYTPRP